MENIATATDDELLSLKTLIDQELDRRESEWRKRLNALQLARGVKGSALAAPKQRATRSDKGKPKAPRALARVEPDPAPSGFTGAMTNAFTTTVGEPDPEFEALS